MSLQRRLGVLVTPLVCGLLALAGAAAPAAGGATPIKARHARDGATVPVGSVDSATLAACVNGTSASARSARFSASMQSLAHTQTMAVEFLLFERAKRGAPFIAVPAPGFDVWQTSNPGIGSFTATENVIDLPAPGAFRAVVHFRWLNARHRVIHIDTRITPPCVEKLAPAPEPDLFVAAIAHAPGSPPATTEDYDVEVRNGGAGAAGSFAVAFSVGQTALPQQTVSGLAPAASTTVRFTGPSCAPGSTLTATVDPSGAITEPANDRRTVTIPCPTAGG